ncbi:MAG: glycosyltransferase family 2 protein [Thiolinea sp.]
MMTPPRPSLISRSLRSALIIATGIYLGLCLMGGLELSYTLQSVITHFFILLAGILVIRQLFLLLSAWVETDSQPVMWPAPDDWQPIVSIIIPAFNEAAVIEPALKSLLALDYPNYEIIMVDDGSTDQTVAKVRETADRYNPQHIPVRIIAQSNGAGQCPLPDACLRRIRTVCRFGCPHHRR